MQARSLHLIDLIAAHQYGEAAADILALLSFEDKEMLHKQVSQILMDILTSIHFALSTEDEKNTALEKFIPFIEYLVSKKELKDIDAAEIYNTKIIPHILVRTSAFLASAIISSWKLENKALILFLVSNFVYAQAGIKAAQILLLNEQREFIKQLIQTAIEKVNIQLLILLIDTFQLKLDDLNLSEALHAKAQFFLAHPHKHLQLQQAASGFLYGFGRITYDHLLLSVAETATRKSYPYTPTILKSNEDHRVDEVDRYLEQIKKMIPPVRERFIAGGVHYICGDIKITKNGQMYCVLIDSLGLKSYDDTSTSVAFKINKRFPDCILYITTVKRQYSSLGCSVISLDDLKHLYTIEKYLSDQYSLTGIFGYLENSYQKKGEIELSLEENEEEKLIAVRQCELPLSFMRLTQSSRLWTKIIPNAGEDEQRCQVNKKGEDILTSLEKHYSYKEVNGKKKRVNHRVEYKFNKMGGRVIHFVSEHSQKQIETMTSQYTLNGFIRKNNAVQDEEKHDSSAPVPGE